MRELNGDLRKVFTCMMKILHLVEMASDRDIGAQNDRSRGQPKNVKRFLGKKATHKTHQCRCRTKEGEKCTERFESREARVAHQVHAVWLGGTHGLKLYVTTVTTTRACPIHRHVCTGQSGTH